MALPLLLSNRSASAVKSADAPAGLILLHGNQSGSFVDEHTHNVTYEPRAAALLELKATTVRSRRTNTAEAAQQARLQSEVQSLANKRAMLKAEMKAEVWQQVRSQLKVHSQAEVREEVRRQVRARSHSQKVSAERQARALVEAEVQAQVKNTLVMQQQAEAKAYEHLGARIDSAASAVVTLETNIEDAASRVDKAVTWLEKVQQDYPNTQAFFFGTVLMVGICCGFTVCWSDVERLATKKQRVNF